MHKICIVIVFSVRREFDYCCYGYIILKNNLSAEFADKSNNHQETQGKIA